MQRKTRTHRDQEKKKGDWSKSILIVIGLGTCYFIHSLALNINQYMMRITNSELYGNLPKVSSKVAQRRLRIAGHAQRHPELTLHSVLLWEPLHGRAGRGRPRQTYIDTLRADTGLQDTRDIANIMEHRERWRDIVHGSRNTTRHKSSKSVIVTVLIF